jgi:hypothetical protein
MRILPLFVHGSARALVFRSMVALFLLLGAGGCAAPLGVSAWPGSDDTDLAEAVAHDSFPTAAEAGVAGQQ